MRDPRLHPIIGDQITRDGKTWTIASVTKLNYFEFPRRVLLQCGPGVRDVKSLTLVEYHDWAEKARPVIVETKTEKEVE